MSDESIRNLGRIENINAFSKKAANDAGNKEEDERLFGGNNEFLKELNKLIDIQLENGEEEEKAVQDIQPTFSATIPGAFQASQVTSIQAKVDPQTGGLKRGEQADFGLQG